MALTKLLLHCDGVDGSTVFTDSSVNAYTVTTAGNVQIDTAQSKFGGASGLFDGAVDYLELADSSDWAYGTGNFSIDFWLYPTSVTGAHAVYEQFTTGDNTVIIFANGTSLAFHVYSALAYIVYFSVADALTINTWQHVAIVRYGTGQNNMYVFIDGTSKTISYNNNLAADASMPDLATVLKIGYSAYGYGSWLGNIDEFRISKGIARWTANFTPPTSAYTAWDAYTQTIAESISSVEYLRNKVQYKRVYVDTISSGEYFLRSGKARYIELFAESISTVDSERDISGWIRKFFESITLADFMDTKFGKKLFFQDLTSLSEYFALKVNYQRKFAENISLADYLTKVIGYKKIAPDGLTMADTMWTSKGNRRTLVETLTLTEHLIRELAYKKVLPDAISLADAIKKAIGKIFPDSVTLTDYFRRKGVLSQRIVDSLNLYERDFTVESTDLDIIEISKNPQIQAGSRQGQLLSLEWVSDVPKFRLVDGRGVSMAGGQPFTMSSGSIINLVYDTGNSVWQEASRSEYTFTQ